MWLVNVLNYLTLFLTMSCKKMRFPTVPQEGAEVLAVVPCAVV